MNDSIGVRQHQLMHPVALARDLHRLASRFGRPEEPVRVRRTIDCYGLVSLAAVGYCEDCGRTVIRATRSWSANRAFRSTCGRCYQWPGERVDHAEWVARRRGESP